MEEHKERLKSSCRICNCDTSAKSYPIDSFVDTFKVAFAVDILQDDPSIHPKRVCTACRSVLGRIDAARKDGKASSTSKTLYNFTEHTESCTICIPTEARPSTSSLKRKRKRGPGRGKRCKTVVAPAEQDFEPTVSPTTPVLLQQVTVSSQTDTNEFMLSDMFQNLPNSIKSISIRNLISNMSVNDKSELGRVLGESQSVCIEQDANALRGVYKELAELKNYDVHNFVTNTNDVTRSFIEGACNVSSTGNAFLVAMVFEQLYKLRVPMIVAPLSFMKNLTMFISKDQRWQCKVNAACSPGGSYTTISSWLDLQSATSEPICPDGDVLNVFDNDQVVGKTYIVKPNNKVNMSVITNRAWIPFPNSQVLQTDPDLLPGKWMGDDNRENFQQAVHKMMIGDIPSSDLNDQLHREQQTRFLKVAIAEVIQEQKEEGSGFRDDIDDEVLRATEERLYYRCIFCDALVLKRKKKCTNQDCMKDMGPSRIAAAQAQQESSAGKKQTRPRLTKVTKEEQAPANLTEERYSHIPSNHPDEPIIVKVADPVFVNPNSFVNLHAVLRKIGKDSGIHRYGGGSRHWTVVCCDGLPYHLCMKLIDATFTCSHCNQSFFGKKEIDQHQTSVHPDDEPRYYREFDWVLLRIGGGHYEMNMVKSFMELNWLPFMSDLCEILSFRSPAAQMSAKRCDSHHKAWSIFVSFVLGSLKELVLHYVRDCLMEKIGPTPQGYMDYARNKRHIPNFTYMHDMVLHYGLAIINFRMGTRRNNSSLVESAKDKFKGMFFGRSHAIYARIEIHDTLQRILYPDPIKLQMSKAASFSKSGDNSKGSDADFILEETNSDSKSWIPRGVPTDKTWLTVCRNLDHLKAIQDHMKEITGTQARASGYRNRNVTSSVVAWRCRLRVKQYISGTDSQHTCITGEKLHEGLSSFRLASESKRSNSIGAWYMGHAASPENFHPVYINSEEADHFNSIEKKTVTQIKDLIENGIATLIDSEDDQAYFKSKFSKTRKKADLISLYNEINSFYSTTEPDEDNDED